MVQGGLTGLRLIQESNKVEMSGFLFLLVSDRLGHEENGAKE